MDSSGNELKLPSSSRKGRGFFRDIPGQTCKTCKPVTPSTAGRESSRAILVDARVLLYRYGLQTVIFNVILVNPFKLLAASYAVLRRGLVGVHEHLRVLLPQKVEKVE